MNTKKYDWYENKNKLNSIFQLLKQALKNKTFKDYQDQHYPVINL